MPPALLKRLVLRNFKTFERFELPFETVNVLVGPNNAGKSTIISAFRLLVPALRRGRARNSERVRDEDNTEQLGHRIARSTLPVEVGHIHHNYDDAQPATAEFRFTNDASVRLLFFANDPDMVVVVSGPGGQPVRTATEFRRTFGFELVAVPVLGHLEEEERLVQRDVVRRNIDSSRASRNFRSYWHYESLDDGASFADFVELMELTWPGMSIDGPPRLEATPDGAVLALWIREGRMTREIQWAGFGCQVWAQLMSHMVRATSDSLLVIDEPETNLHPDLQRRLMNLIRQRPSQVVLATHSPEIITEADASEVIVIDSALKRGKRLRAPIELQSTLDTLGVRRNLALSRLSRSRRAIYVEGDDFKVLRRFAGRIGLTDLEGTSEITDIPLGGFQPEQAALIARGVALAIGVDPKAAIVLDRDYRSDAERQRVMTALAKDFALAHIFDRKEIENYVLVPKALQRAVASRLSSRRRKELATSDIERLLRKATTPMKAKVQSRLVRDQVREHRSSGKDEATITEEAIEMFDTRWKDLEWRLQVAPGKDVLAKFNDLLQKNYSISLSLFRIIDAMTENDVPADLQVLLRDLDRLMRSPTT